MQTSQEWPSATKSSSMRRKITCATLAVAVDRSKFPRFESYSDGDDELSSLEPPDADAYCRNCGYGDGLGIQSSGYGGKGKGVQISGFASNRKNVESSGYGETQEMRRSVDGYYKGLENPGYGVKRSGYGDGQGFDTRSNTAKISSSKEPKVKFPANLRVDHSSVAPQQPLRVNAPLFSGLPKPAGKPHTARLIIPAHLACEEKTKEPISPKVTCLGRVRIKDDDHDTEHAHTEQKAFGDAQRHTLESKKQSLDKNHHDGSIKKGIAQKSCCLSRGKRREDTELGIWKVAASAAARPLETRRERGAFLARTMTSLLEDLRRLDMENGEYVPAVPPPNSLLLMRGPRGMKKPCNQEVSRDGNNTINENACEDISAQKISPLSELESNSLGQSAQGLALWQRRAVAKLAAIDTRRPMRVEIKQPNTN